MKEATGELSMTVIVIIAVIAILAILTVFLLPQMRNYISNTWGSWSDQGNKEVQEAQNMG